MKVLRLASVALTSLHVRVALYLLLTMMIYLIIIAISLLIFHLKIRYSNSGIIIDRIPGPIALPFFGNTLMFNLPSDQMWLKVLELFDQYYPILRIWFFNSAAVFIRHPEDLKILLSCKRNISKAKIGYDNFRFIGNEGLIISTGDKWRARRKMLSPAFNQKLLRVYGRLTVEHMQKFIVDLRSQGSEIIVDLMAALTKLNFDIAVETTMGVDLNNLGIECEEACKEAFFQICDVSFYRASRPYIRDWMMRFLSIGRKQAKAVKILRDLINKIVEERRNYHKQHGYEMLRKLDDDEEDSDAMIGKKKLRLAVLDRLLAAQLDGLIDEDGIREEVEVVLAAGLDTMSVAMAFTLMLFAENQKAQELARAEVLAVAESNNGELINNDIQKLDYLDRCVQESLRMFPPSPVIARHISHDLHLRNYTIPASNEAFINFYALHRDPNFWPTPDKFDPDRFLPENSIARHAFAYLPFSAGPRVCIGQKFALMELKVMLAHVIANFRIEAVDSTADVQFAIHIALKPTKPIRAKFISTNSLLLR